jgi:5,6-dimethylbenzimidazole synthase
MTHKHFTIDDQATLEALLMHRRDVRGNNFLPDELPQEAIDQILYAASLAPSVGFSQPWEFVIVKDPDVRQQIHQSFNAVNESAASEFSDEKQALYDRLKLEGILETPVNIAVFYKPSAEPVLGQHSMLEAGEYSVVCAIQNMWLMSRAMNIGMGWVSILNPEDVKKALNAPENHKLVAYLCLGYVKEFYATPELETLRWEKRKEIESLIHQDRYPDSYE